MIKSIKYFFEAFFIYLFFLISKIIGLSFSRIIFSFLFRKIGPVIRGNDTILKNINNFSKNISVIEQKRIISNMWANYGMTFVEYIFLNRFKKENTHIEIKNENILEEIKKNKKPVIFVSGHFANFELMSIEITKKNISLATIYRPLNNFFLNPFMEYLRKKFVCSNQIKKGRSGVKDSINYLKKNYSVALMIDQRVSEGEKINFFGKKALTTTLPAQLAKKFNLNIVPIYIERKNTNSFFMEIYNPITISQLKSKVEISLELNKILEEMISRNPNQWIWTHNRWK
jgi:Kdo2-lipid IVA lauroyltransferase/acyltransferase